ncbi:hypothetical protein LZ31DRAFT_560624 [Colletotrichum somersetense]|nr:hypothetical protein LZ31DRAFT_560624 [Colletotrichum somersetense]
MPKWPESPSGFGPPLYEGDEPNLEQGPAHIIVVHGIGAHRDFTWSEQGVKWLSREDMLPSCFPRARIMAYGYASDWLGVQSIATCLVALADRLLELLHDLRKVGLVGIFSRAVICLTGFFSFLSTVPGDKYFFIMHCFGGIVVEKTMLKALARDTEIDRLLISATSGIILLETPHRGSSSAELAHIVAGIAAAFDRAHRSPILNTLSNETQLLEDTVRNFIMQAHRLHLKIYCFYEERETDITQLTRPLLGKLLPTVTKVISVFILRDIDPCGLS